MKWWRKMLRGLALLAPLLYFFFPKETLLLFVGGLLLLLTPIELYRLYNGAFNAYLFANLSSIFKEKERHRVSAIFLLLASLFFLLLLFQKDIAITAMVFMILGDWAAAYVGEYFGKTKLFHRSLEGSLALLFTCLIAGLILRNFLNISLYQVLAGSITASVVELCSVGIDDNATVGILSALIMSVLA